MKGELFIDTSGFYAILAKRDDAHDAALQLLAKAEKDKTRFVTTDYILDETATLLHMKGLSHILDQFFDRVFDSKACIVEWMDPERFARVRNFFLRHFDHRWSLTDCFSFSVMKERNLSQALTKDRHFSEAGFVVLL